MKILPMNIMCLIVVQRHTQEWFSFFLSLPVSHTLTADLKRTIAVLLDDILTRLVKLEGKIELVVNASSTNTSHTAGGVLASAPAALQRAPKQDTPGSHPGTSRFHPHIPNRPRPHQGA